MKGFLFHVASIRESIPDSPNGVWAENSLIEQNKILKMQEVNGIKYYLALINPLAGIGKNALAYTLSKFTEQALPDTKNYGKGVPIEIYAESPFSQNFKDLIDKDIKSENSSEELLEIVEQILSDGHKIACEFINVLINKFDQYWLIKPNDLFQWGNVLYFSKNEQSWYPIIVRDHFVTNLLKKDWNSENDKTYRPYVLTKIIAENDLEELRAISSAQEPSFAEEMIAIALIELTQNRKRSSILHSIIAYESVAKRGLETLVKKHLSGLESGSILEAISREISTVNLGKVVYSHAQKSSSENDIIWEKIEKIYNTRNMIVHCGQRKLPSFKDIREQIIEIRKYILKLQLLLLNY